jgi:hypothetical protein
MAEQQKLPGYDWDAWLEPGTSWAAVRGVDFVCTPAGFRSAVHAAATTRGVVVRTKLGNDTVYWSCKEAKNDVQSVDQ